MRNYDWGFGFGFDARHPAFRRPRREGGFRGGRGGGPGGGRYDRDHVERYDSFGRGLAGEPYPGFGGVPGGRAEGTYYGRHPGGSDEPRRGSYAPGPAPRAGREPDGHRWSGYDVDDHQVERAVWAGLQRDPWLDAEGIEIEVEGGVVTLRGEVSGFLESRYAWDDAWETDGVRGVRNELRVREAPQTGGGEEAAPGDEADAQPRG